VGSSNVALSRYSVRDGRVVVAGLTERDHPWLADLIVLYHAFAGGAAPAAGRAARVLDGRGARGVRAGPRRAGARSGLRGPHGDAPQAGRRAPSGVSRGGAGRRAGAGAGAGGRIPGAGAVRGDRGRAGALRRSAGRAHALCAAAAARPFGRGPAGEPRPRASGAAPCGRDRGRARGARAGGRAARSPPAPDLHRAGAQRGRAGAAGGLGAAGALPPHVALRPSPGGADPDPALEPALPPASALRRARRRGGVHARALGPAPPLQASAPV
jgi:hypothetical protein